LIRNIVLDMGNVLLDFDPVRFTKRFVQEDEDVRAIVRALFGCPEWIGGDLGTYSDEEIVACACKCLPERLHSAVKAVMEDFYRQMPAYPGTKEMIEGLLGMGFDLYLLSNVGIHYDEMRKNIPLIDKFKGEFLSYQVNLLKPQPEIFTAFCERFRLNPENCLFVDDSPANVFGAMRAGMQGFVFRGEADALLQFAEENK